MDDARAADDAWMERDARLVERVVRGQRWATALGLLLVALGGGYAAWAVASFDPRADPRLGPRWDVPVARIASLYDRFTPALARFEPQTQAEARLARGLQAQLRFSAGLLLLAARVLIGTIFALGGLAALTVAVERRRLLGVIARLRAREDALCSRP